MEQLPDFRNIIRHMGNILASRTLTQFDGFNENC